MPKPARVTQQAEHGDPEEVDISEHFYAPATTNRIPQHSPSLSATPPLDPASMSEAQLRQMMLGFDRVGTPGAGVGAAGGGNLGGGGGGADDDPMMKIMQQMMTAGGGPPLPGASPFGPQQQGQAVAAVPDRYSALWRLLHTAVALGLGLYIALWTSFSGTKLERDQSGLAAVRGGDKPGGGAAEPDPRLFFWLFATAETVLLTTRFFLDRSRGPPAGVLWSVASFLPEPFKGYLGIALRYGQIFSTVKSDILVCIFVLGACSWLRAA